MIMRLFLTIILIVTQGYSLTAKAQGSAVLIEQINAVQRALVAYKRINPYITVSPTMAPSIDDLVLQGYLPKTDDLRFYAGTVHLYTLWDGEIKVTANYHHLFIRVEKLPHRICKQLLQKLQKTSPRSSCQGEENDPLDWQLQIPLVSVKLFVD